MTTAEYNQCVTQYADGLYRFVLKQSKDVNISKDIVQDTFEKCWLRRDEVSFSKAKSYLFTTCYHTYIDYHRKEKVRYTEPLSSAKMKEDKTQYSDLKEVLDKALDLLPEVQKSVILLRDYEGYNYDEIGEITGLNESQVKVYIYRARMFLKNYIQNPELVL